MIESFLSYSSGLTDPAATADPDGDGAANLLEYASGSDPSLPSSTALPETKHTQVSGQNRIEFSFVRRTDAAERALTYTVQSSDSLESDSWDSAADEVLSRNLSNRFQRAWRR